MADDLLGNLKFVKVAALHDLRVAEELQKVLRSQRVAAVIINDERYQHKSETERAEAEPDGDAFRIEVPEAAARRAREIIDVLMRETD
jgi:hypothetical protein